MSSHLCRHNNKQKDKKENKNYPVCLFLTVSAAHLCCLIRLNLFICIVNMFLKKINENPEQAASAGMSGMLVLGYTIIVRLYYSLF